MGQYWLNVAILRIIIPVTFTACVIWRPTGMSLIYLMLLMISPFIPIPTYETMRKSTGFYLKFSVALCCLTTLCQAVFQIMLAASLEMHEIFVKNCTFMEELFRHIGLVRLDHMGVLDMFYWILPEIIALPMIITMYYLCQRFTPRRLANDPEISSIQEREKVLNKNMDDANEKIINFLGRIGTYVVLATLCFAACLTPSIEAVFYFLIFFGAATWWACHRELEKGFAIICRIAMVYTIIHVVAFTAYQNQWPQEHIPANSTWARYFAFDAYHTTNCSDPRQIIVAPKKTDEMGYTYGLWLFWLYYVLALQSQFLFRKPSLQNDTSMRLSNKLKNLDTQLSRHVSIKRRTPSQRWQSARRKARKAAVTPTAQPDERTPLMRFGSGRSGLLQDSTGSVIVQDGNHDEGIQLQSVSEGASETKPGTVEHVIMGVYAIFQLVVNSSHLATNIMMMAWSIMYHSWTTFVFLLWALVLWMFPNKRAFMLKCSPFIVFYGTVLLLVGYVYSLNLTEDELPQELWGVSMAEIGFPSADVISSWHLIIKCAFMAMFWITMRQYMAEQHHNKRTSTLRDMVAPLHLSVTAATAMHQDTPEIKSKFMNDVGKVVQKLLTKFWIIVVAIMLFTSGITGERMTVFRIIYMTLFLVFVISFQISWAAWRKMMFGFWITVIAYSVVMLILVYTYQFPNFPKYWNYIHIDDDLQKDIGLEVYETKDLFVRLLTPTFFVIITVIQIHYFHTDFLEATNIEKITVDSVSQRDSLGRSSSIGPEMATLDVLLTDGEDHSPRYTLKQLKQMSKLERAIFYRRTLEELSNFYNHIWLFFEIHIQKIIFTSMMILCIKDVCAINFIFVTVIVVTINFKKSIQIITINSMAVAVAILLVTKMLYQIQYIDHNSANVNCSSDTSNTSNNTKYVTYNIAEWIGMKKAAHGMLPDLLKGYIGIVTVTTVRAIIMVRQCFHRSSRGESLDTPQVMFPKITRADADEGIAYCLKFFFNYGFYKFGLEFCLITIVALIGTRLDFYSVIYGIWLLVLFAQSRRVTAIIWPFFHVFVIVIIPIQYALAVAPPPWFCIDYPWEHSQMLKRLQGWMYLPDPDSPPNARNLICDFLLLFMITRQSLAFRIESRHIAAGTEFVAGHNSSIFRESEKPNFVNPVKDYVSHIHCWLDIVKRGTMMSFLWITLSIMFLAGTKRTNLFSLGYLIGAFIFLWQGGDFYLRPSKVIIKWWNLLIGYNVIVIVTKAILQGIGCVLIEQLEESACWLVQLLGISCLQDALPPINPVDVYECHVSREDVGMVWDGLCFACLIIQKRLFKSYYFFHIVNETKAMSILASRGAELLEDIHRKRIEFQESVERAGLQKIKLKMDKIKADQQRIQGPSYREPTDYKVGVAPLARASSASSCISSGRTPPQGYRTPIDSEEDSDDDLIDERRDYVDDDPLLLTSRAASLLQAPSPNSAILTVSLDGYLEPTRISFGSPPNSELNPRGVSPDETFPVFSPPPHDRLPHNNNNNNNNSGNNISNNNNDRSCRSSIQTHHRRQWSYGGTTWMSDIPTTPRRSIVSFTSRSPRSHHTYSIYPRDRPLYRQRAPKTNREAVRSGDYYMFDDIDDDDTTDLMPDFDAEFEAEKQRRVPRHGSRRMTVSELMTTLLKTDIEIATHVAMYGGTAKDALRLRRQSAPLTRKKSSMSYLSARSDSDTAGTTDEVDRTSEVGEDKSQGMGDEDEMKKVPGPSDADEPLDDTEDIAVDGEKTKRVSLMTYFKFILELINSFMISATKYLNRFSRDYRYIRKILAKEKQQLKEKSDFSMSMRLGVHQIWKPISMIKKSSGTDGSTDETTVTRDDESRQKTSSTRKESSLTVPHIRILAPSLERGLDESSSSSTVSRIETNAKTEEEQEPELSEMDQPPIIQLIASLWFGALAHSTFVCYFMIFLHQVRNASVLSTPLPLMVFFWGSLTIPRPSKTFWVTIIAYTEAIVIVKCIYQLELIGWNPTRTTKNPLDTARIMGVERKLDYALWDLLLLLVVFFHRYMLKTMGQWTTAYTVRKINPVEATIEQSSNTNSQNEPTRLHWQNEKQKKPTPPPESDQEPSTSHDPKLDSSGNDEGTGEEHDDIDDYDETIVQTKVVDTNVCTEPLSSAFNLTIAKYFEPTRIFFAYILNPEGKEKTNVYAYMFLCDFLNFLLVIFGFPSFGPQQSDDGVTNYLEENRVPMSFLAMLLIQFALIVFDRALYLKKSISGKLKFHYGLVFLVHLWMFFILPGITERQFIDNVLAQTWYMIKCFYLLLAAYQLRLGYPTRILGNFLCKNYSIINYGLFKGFMMVPFLFELRAVMDWIWTDTSMTIMDWFKMEDIFANIYQIKCMRGVESDYPQPRGVKRQQISKYMTGGGLLLLIIGLIWFPLLFFALGRTAGITNRPYEVSLKIRIGSHESIYTTSARDSAISPYTRDDFATMKSQYSDRAAVSFLENYGYADVATVALSGSSQTLWAITPPDKEQLRQDLMSNDTIIIIVEWTVSRKTDVKELSDIATNKREISLKPYISGEFNPVRKSLAAILASDADNSNTSIILNNAFPKFLKVTSRKMTIARPMMYSLKVPETHIENDTVEAPSFHYRNITLQLASDGGQHWWIIRENCDDEIYKNILESIPKMDCQFMVMFLFNDKILPAGWSFISGFGILGLYTTAVILVSQIMRRSFSEMAPKIMFDDMPYVDRVLRLCLDVYLVRESKELCLEEDLFAKLIFLYRSPETLIRWTRPPEPTNFPDGNDDDDDDNDDVSVARLRG